MITVQDFHQLRDRITKLEEEVAMLRKQAAGPNWEQRIIEQINKGDMLTAMRIYQDFDRYATVSEATRRVLEIKKRLAK